MSLPSLLVLATNYPALDKTIKSMYVHTRNLYYQENGYDVTVVNFETADCYEIDGIKVISVKEYAKIRHERKFDVAVSHAANLRNHFLFLRKYKKDFACLVFVFHGHEVLRMSKDYPKPYFWKQNSPYIKRKIQDCYDWLKLRLWRNYFLRNIEQSHFIFVSNWMLERFVTNLKISQQDMKGHYSVVYNSVGKAFEYHNYSRETPHEYDFVTIRPIIDGAKYCVDIVNSLAWKNQERSFLVIGKGELFSHIEKAPNLTWKNQTLNHSEICSVLDSCRCALMPTRTDAQGVSMCEMATYGIPVITSDIPVCHEALGLFENVRIVDLQKRPDSLSRLLEEPFATKKYEKNTKFFRDNTCGKELSAILTHYKNCASVSDAKNIQ